ncbi:lytic transglycosylase domain-containing protein [Altererythrobacter sp. MF3-039]|uniref:lytic transglycosylase domain-containing protein n=1 Tax=Altererythrobacter sp. MF3-039 TaxID=3252901 RepID=UPI00390C5E0C
MSSMDRKALIIAAGLATTVLPASAPISAQSVSVEDRARASLVARAPTRTDLAINQWEWLTESANKSAGFGAYAGFLLAYPGYPKETLLRVRAEESLDNEPISSAELVAFFEQYPPLTNSAKARYALALSGMQHQDAFELARESWRGGSMSGPAEAYMTGMFGARFTEADHDARMDALLWQGNLEAAQRQSALISASARPEAMARLALLSGSASERAGLSRTDPGYVYNLAQFYQRKGNLPAAINLLANRPAFETLPHNAEDFVSLALRVAKAAGSRQAVQIASKTDDLFGPGFDVSEGSFVLRDKMTDLMWLGGTKALWTLGDGAAAAPLFYRYGTSAKTPLTRSKGFYWAGKAAGRARNTNEATRYFELAAAHPEYYYGQLAIAELGRPMPEFAPLPALEITPDQRAEFDAQPAVEALRAVARTRRDWRTERALFEAIADNAKTPAEMRMVADLARETGLQEFEVVAGMSAGEHGLDGFERLGFPTTRTHGGANWTMVHAIARQESEFDRNRVSHAGARGMMQLMPGTAREEAGKIGVQYMSASLTADPSYNIRLGDAHFARLMDRYGGSYPLAIAAYNAGPGRVSQWLRLNGDPRTGAIDWPQWIERIPANFETRYYVMRVIGNAVTYANMHPDKSRSYERDVRHYLR